MLGVLLEKDAPMTKEYYVCDHFTAPNEYTARALAEIAREEGMTDTTPTHCGHDPRHIVQADEGTAYCAMCELEAVRAELMRVKETARQRYEGHKRPSGDFCFCEVCEFALEIIK